MRREDSERSLGERGARGELKDSSRRTWSFQGYKSPRRANEFIPASSASQNPAGSLESTFALLIPQNSLLAPSPPLPPPVHPPPPPSLRPPKSPCGTSTRLQLFSGGTFLAAREEVRVPRWFWSLTIKWVLRVRVGVRRNLREFDQSSVRRGGRPTQLLQHDSPRFPLRTSNSPPPISWRSEHRSTRSGLVENVGETGVGHG